ncbi:MAG: phosphate signaling complex protein PhoU [Ruminococcaceae bacterium]|jgi:phosphate transport system protein|nr:phosphate signaling complex protein PhoU [Oscillospiraceae bacterium]
MRATFDQQLDSMNKELTYMGALCETAIANAAKALLDGDNELARRVLIADEEIDRKESEIEAICLKLLLHQQPVARDLRQISAALKMITDMERIGDQAGDIAEIVSMANITADADILHVREMANATIEMVTSSIEAFVKKDQKLANAVLSMDDKVDDLFNKVKAELIELIGSKKTDGETAIDILMIAKYFERIGDHATNIAEWVIFSITGVHKSSEN